MNVSRRNFILASVSLMAAGCAHTPPARELASAPRPSAEWPDHGYIPHAGGLGTAPPAPAAKPNPAPIVAREAPPAPAIPQPAPGGIQAIPRSSWASASPIMARVNPMEGINRITIHHEGWTPAYFTDVDTMAERLDLIRKSHIQRLGAGDIGYHFIIDRAGRVWQGRDVKYQGAHVRNNNEHNVGVMVLGNFDVQTPTDAQLTSLRDTVSKLIRQYRVSNRAGNVLTHREINPTDCPGTNLQPRTLAIRPEAARLAGIA